MADSLLGKFISMAPARLTEMGEAIASLEDDPSPSLIRKIGRDFHTLKGESRLVEIPQIERLAHAAEDVLFSHQKANAIGEATQRALYEAVDTVFAIVSSLESSSPTPDDAVEATLARLHAAVMPEPTAGGAAQAPTKDEVDSAVAAGVPHVAHHEASGEAPAADTHESSSRGSGSMAHVSKERLERIGELAVQAQGSIVLNKTLLDDIFKLCGDMRVMLKQDAPASDAMRSLREKAQQTATAVRDLREKMASDEALHRELNEALRGTRLHRLGTVFDIYPSYARQAARAVEKQVRVEMRNMDVQLERDVLDTIAEPCMHILRNGIAHGIETPEARKRAGKDPTGTITITALQEGDSVRIDFTDDGQGLNLEKIGERALAMRLITLEQLDKMSEKERTALIFHSGLSTSDKVDELSGRGVGMDVVADTLQRLGGSIEVRTTAGQGSAFTVRIPISTSVLSGMVVQACDQLFAVPSAALIEVFWLSVKDINIEGGSEYVMFRGKLLPLVRLRDVLGLRGIKDIFVNKVVVVVVRHGENTVGVVVERCLGERQLVMSRLEGLVERAPMTYGVVVLEDGGVLVVLSPSALVSQQRTATHGQHAAHIEKTGASTTAQERRVLYAEDSLITREYTAGLLRTQGFNVTEVEDGVAALEALKNGTFDLLLTDLQMPRMDGFRLVSSVRGTRSPYQNVPIVIMSTVDAPETKRMALQSGADAYIVKSQFDLQLLLSTIRQVMR